MDKMRSKLEDLKELRDLVRSLGRGGGWGPLRRAPIQYLDMKVCMVETCMHYAHTVLCISSITNCTGTYNPDPALCVLCTRLAVEIAPR